MSTPGDPRATPQRIGRVGEELARNHLEARGYRVIASNYRCRWGEIDLVARDGDEWVFVEVRARRSDTYGGPEESVTEAKARRLILAAQDFLAQSDEAGGDPEWRIDLVAIRLGSGRRVLSIEHMTHAVSE